jgi:hypothetical protein
LLVVTQDYHALVFDQYFHRIAIVLSIEYNGFDLVEEVHVAIIRKLHVVALDVQEDLSI